MNANVQKIMREAPVKISVLRSSTGADLDARLPAILDKAFKGGL